MLETHLQNVENHKRNQKIFIIYISLILSIFIGIVIYVLFKKREYKLTRFYNFPKSDIYKKRYLAINS